MQVPPLQHAKTYTSAERRDTRVSETADTLSMDVKSLPNIHAQRTSTGPLTQASWIIKPGIFYFFEAGKDNR